MVVYNHCDVAKEKAKFLTWPTLGSLPPPALTLTVSCGSSPCGFCGVPWAHRPAHSQVQAFALAAPSAENPNPPSLICTVHLSLPSVFCWVSSSNEAPQPLHLKLINFFTISSEGRDLSIFHCTATSLPVRIVHGICEVLNKYFLNEMYGRK